MFPHLDHPTAVNFLLTCRDIHTSCQLTRYRSVDASEMGIPDGPCMYYMSVEATSLFLRIRTVMDQPDSGKALRILSLAHTRTQGPRIREVRASTHDAERMWLILAFPRHRITPAIAFVSPNPIQHSSEFLKLENKGSDLVQALHHAGISLVVLAPIRHLGCVSFASFGNLES